MDTLYYIRHDGSDTELSSVGGSGLTLNRRTGAVSTARWQCDAPFDSVPLWAYGSEVTVLRKTDGEDEILLQGTVTMAEGDGSPGAEAFMYEVSDAWYHLEREAYRPSRKIVDVDGNLADYASGRVLLCQTADGQRMTAAAMCRAIAEFAASIGIAVQAGTFDAPVLPPWDEVVDRMLSEIILRVLRWQPDAVAWLDHTVTPPALNVSRRSNLPQSTVPFSTLNPDLLRIRACPELVIPGCVISFELAGAAGRTVSEQSAGDPDALGCVRMTIPLEFEAGMPGPSQTIKVAALGDYTQADWWRVMFPWLPSGSIISDAMMLPTAPEGYDNVLTYGAVTDWMRDRGIDAGRFTISCLASFTRDGQTFTEKELSRSFTLTNAESRRYIGRFQPGWSEPEPAGLAAAFYAAASVLQYAGKIGATELECKVGRQLIGRRLNISGSEEAWSAMGATVTAVSETFDDGVTLIELGTQSHLGPADLVELLRCSRSRSTWTPLSPLDGGVPEDEEDDPFSPEETTAEAPGQLSALELIDPEEG